MQIRNDSGQRVRLELHQTECAGQPYLKDISREGVIVLSPGFDSTFALGTGGWTYTERQAIDNCLNVSLKVAQGESAENPPYLIVNAFGYRDSELTVVFE